MKIIFYGPLGNNIPKSRVGGAEVGCRRSVDLLRSDGFEVFVVDKPTLEYGLVRFVKDFLNAYRELKTLFKDNTGSIFYLVGFYNRQIYCEYLLCRLAEKYNMRVVYEPKNGALVNKYKSGSKLYKSLSNYIFDKAKIIFCQGKEYRVFLESIGFKNAVYLPNYVSNKNLSYIKDERSDKITFMYFGRLIESKNIDLIINIFYKFFKCNSNSELILVGSGSKAYTDSLSKYVEELGVVDNVFFTGRLDFEDIAVYLNRSHFFLFPSSEEYEGHSNSLTEAMAYGVVPISSAAGFSRSVIGNDYLIVDELNPDSYLKVILDILNQDKWKYYSDCVKFHSSVHFSEDAIKEKYLEEVRGIM